MKGPCCPLGTAEYSVTLSRKNTSNCDRGGSAFRTNFRKMAICSVKLLVVKTHPTVTDARFFYIFGKCANGRGARISRVQIAIMMPKTVQNLKLVVITRPTVTAISRIDVSYAKSCFFCIIQSNVRQNDL